MAICRVPRTVGVGRWSLGLRGVVGISTMRVLRHSALANDLYRSVCWAWLPAEQLHGDTYE